LEVEANNTDAEKLNELFRPFHTIKGIAGFLNLRDINRLTHEIETILDQGRRGETTINAGVVDLIFAAVDTLKTQLGAIRQYMAAPTGEPCPQPEITDIMHQLRRAAAGLTDFGARATRPTLGELLVASGTVEAPDGDDGVDEPAGEVTSSRQAGAHPAATDDALKRTTSQPQDAGKAMLDSSIRVDTGKLDALVDAVGELVIAQSMVGLSEKIHEDEKLARNVAQVTKIVRDVQETAMGMRMVPIGHTFQKMRRLVRDLSRKVSKAVELTISGEETELDKNVIQQISDPLVHLVRNAIDHGIERPEVRRAAGKPEAGQVQLNAYHQGDSIVIEIRDDGKGLDRDVLIAKGIERGLVGPEDQLTEQQAFALILQPGFSTAEKVTDVSGRGVGMDVVKRNVEQLRGKIEIQSEKGKGSVFMIRLPLTLAIIDGMLVRVNAERMIIPTILIEQSLRPEARQITSVQRRGAMVQVRGELCPLIQLGALFGYNTPVDPCENLVVIVQAEGRKIALVVEELIGQQQVVIKTLGERFKKIKGVSGAAILGDGRVGLILEPSGVLALHNQSRTPAFAATPAAVAAAANPDADETGAAHATAPVEPALAAV
jgi:two-component system chemotaxis sensor kinase CheA